MGKYGWIDMKGNYSGKDGDYEIQIDSVKRKFAYCTVSSGSGEDTYIKIPKSDLEKECEKYGGAKSGLLLTMDVKNHCRTFNFKLIKRKPMSKKQLNKRLAYYQKKYGNV